MESSKEYARYECWNVGPNLRRTLQGYCHREPGSILLRGFGRKTTSPGVECPQSKEVLSVIIRARGYKLNVISYVRSIN